MTQKVYFWSVFGLSLNKNWTIMIVFKRHFDMSQQHLITLTVGIIVIVIRWGEAVFMKFLIQHEYKYLLFIIIIIIIIIVHISTACISVSQWYILNTILWNILGKKTQKWFNDKAFIRCVCIDSYKLSPTCVCFLPSFDWNCNSAKAVSSTESCVCTMGLVFQWMYEWMPPKLRSLMLTMASHGTLTALLENPFKFSNREKWVSSWPCSYAQKRNYKMACCSVVH